MSGICGWTGWGGEDAGAALARMLAGISEADGNERAERLMPDVGLGARWRGGAGCIVEDARHVLAIVGHPRWTNSGIGAESVEKVGRRLLNAIVADGPSALGFLAGDFALALVERDSGATLLAVDRIGIRTLCYQTIGTALLFGSTLDAIGAHPDALRTLNLQAVYDFVYFHMIPGPETVFRDQLRLLPGHYLQFSAGKVHAKPYWRMHFEENDAQAVEHYKQDFLDALHEATARCSAGESCGAFLSGGTDSSTITGMLGAVTGKVAKTYSIGFDAAGYDEMEYARIAARHFRADHHEYYVTPADVVDAIPKIAAAYDQPFGNASAVPTYYCARLASRDGVHRLLGGDGGDELFGGNARYAKQRQLAMYDHIPSVLRRGVLEPLLLRAAPLEHIPLARKARSYVAQARVPMPARYESYNLLDRIGPANVFTDQLLAEIDTRHPHRVLEEAFAAYRGDSLINQMLGIDLKLTLADNDLPKVTRMCELAGVDVTFPMLDEDVVALSARLPSELKLKGKQLRYFFKEALRDFLPREIITKEKHGFGLPVGKWLTEYEPLREIAVSCVEELRTKQIIRPEFIDFLGSRALREHSAYYGTMLWVLMTLSLWMRQRGV